VDVGVGVTVGDGVKVGVGVNVAVGAGVGVRSGELTSGMYTRCLAMERGRTGTLGSRCTWRAGVGVGVGSSAPASR